MLFSGAAELAPLCAMTSIAEKPAREYLTVALKRIISICANRVRMGVDISGIVEAKQCSFDEFKGKVVAIDAYNALYQFLASIRQPDGTQLMDSHGRVTSHLAGLFSRTATMIEMGIRPVYVFDGPPNALKLRTLRDRRGRREQAAQDWKDALEAGDMETARTKAQQSTSMSRTMAGEAKELLGYLGVPHVDAPGEGEAQASHMVTRGDAWAAASQDYDCLLFGAPKLARNLTLAGRRKLPRQEKYVTVVPEVIDLVTALATLKFTRSQLVDLGILIGTDFNEGIRGIGPKKGLKLLQECSDAEGALVKLGREIPSIDAVRKLFNEPDVTDDYKLAWHTPDRAAVIRFLCEERDFTPGRVEPALQKLDNSQAQMKQKSLDRWF
jgi:flap endonuclease-1